MSETAAILADALRVIRLRTIEECARIAERAHMGMWLGEDPAAAQYRTATEAARRIRALAAETPECDALNHTQDDSSIQSDCQAQNE